MDVDNKDEQSDDSLSRTLYAAGNLVWSLLRQVDMGTARRIQATSKFKF